jgi:hypothetical protein
MPVTTQEVAFSFLTSGPGFRFDLPSDFDSLPELSSPLRNGHGSRSFDFAPAQRDFGIDEAIELLRTLSDRDGRTVSLFWRLDPPPLWWLHWSLSNGSLYSHLREEDGEQMSDTTVASLGIFESPTGGPPFLLPDPPLEFATSSAPGFQDVAFFSSAQRGQDWGIAFLRPGYVATGRILTARSTVINFVAGTRFGLDVRVWSSSDAAAGRALVNMVTASLTDT